jgi:hypothetical protein
MTWKASIAVHAQDLRNQGITASDKTVENWVSLGVNTLREKRTRGRPLHELALPVGKLVQIANELGGMAPSNAGSPSTLSELVVRVCRCCWVLKKMLVLLLLTGVSILSLPFTWQVEAQKAQAVEKGISFELNRDLVRKEALVLVCSFWSTWHPDWSSPDRERTGKSVRKKAQQEKDRKAELKRVATELKQKKQDLEEIRRLLDTYADEHPENAAMKRLRDRAVEAEDRTRVNKAELGLLKVEFEDLQKDLANFTARMMLQNRGSCTRVDLRRSRSY